MDKKSLILSGNQYDRLIDELSLYLLSEALIETYMVLSAIKSKIDLIKDKTAMINFLQSFDRFNGKLPSKLCEEIWGEIIRLQIETNCSPNLTKELAYYIIFRILKYLQVKGINFPDDVNLLFDFESRIKEMFKNEEIDENWFLKYNTAKNPLEKFWLEFSKVVPNLLQAFKYHNFIIESRLAMMPSIVDQLLEL